MARQGFVFPLALPCPEVAAQVAAHRGSRSCLSMGWPVAKLPSGTLGLAGSCHGLFWGVLQLHSAAGMPVPSRAVLGVGSSQQRGLCWARKAQSSQAKWSSLSLGDQHGCIFPGAERGTQDVCSSSGCALEEGPSLQHQAPCTFGQSRMEPALGGTVLGDVISLSQPRAHWLALGVASCTVASLFTGICLINFSQLPLLGQQSGWAEGIALPVGSWPCSTGGSWKCSVPSCAQPDPVR